MFIEDVCWCRHTCCYRVESDFTVIYWACDNYDFDDDGEWACACHEPMDRPWEDYTWD